MALGAIRKNLLLLGTCMPCMRHNTSKIRVMRLDLDTNLLAYFKKEELYYAHDPNKVCKTGDVVLIELLEKKLSPSVTHKVIEVVYPMGDITDPITGKKCVAGLYRDEIMERSNCFGRLPSSFDYEKAPPRGWLQDKRDFSHRESYVKYHEFPDDDQPYSL